MRPFLIVFGMAIPMFFVMAMLAIIVSFGLVLACTRKSNRLDAVHYFVVIICGAFVGAWLLHTLVNLPRIINAWQIISATMTLTNALEYVFTQLSGMVFYGGLLGGLAAMLAYSKYFKVPLLPFMDMFAPIVLVAHAVGRLGCFFAGCCYGMVIDASHPLAIVYPPGSLGAPYGVPLLAMPLIEASFNLIIAGAIYIFVRIKRPSRPGYCVVIYLLAYPAVRFILEFFRGDIMRGVLLGMSTSQWISIGLFSAGVALYISLRRNVYIPYNQKQGS